MRICYLLHFYEDFVYLCETKERCIFGIKRKRIDRQLHMEEKKWKILKSEYLIRRPWLTARQYRHALGKTSYELPSGVMEEGEEPLEAIQRELLEETGYGGGEWVHLMDLSANSSTMNNLTHCFLATGVEKISEPHLDSTEDLEVFLLSREKVWNLLNTNQLVQSLMVAPLWMYFSQFK